MSPKLLPKYPGFFWAWIWTCRLWRVLDSLDLKVAITQRGHAKKSEDLPLLLGGGFASQLLSLWQQIDPRNRTHRTHGTHGPRKNLSIDHSSVSQLTERGPLGFGPIQFLIDTVLPEIWQYLTTKLECLQKLLVQKKPPIPFYMIPTITGVSSINSRLGFITTVCVYIHIKYL